MFVGDEDPELYTAQKNKMILSHGRNLSAYFNTFIRKEIHGFKILMCYPLLNTVRRQKWKFATSREDYK